MIPEGVYAGEELLSFAGWSTRTRGWGCA